MGNSWGFYHVGDVYAAVACPDLVGKKRFGIFNVDPTGGRRDVVKSIIDRYVAEYGLRSDSAGEDTPHILIDAETREEATDILYCMFSEINESISPYRLNIEFKPGDSIDPTIFIRPYDGKLS